MTIQNIRLYQNIVLFQIICLCLPLHINAQIETNLELDKIESKHVCRAIKERGLLKLTSIQQLEPTCHDGKDKSYYEHVKTYSTPQSLQETWKTYTSLNIKKAWSGKLIDYGFVYDGNNSTILYPDQANQNIEVGRKIFFNVHLLGFLNLVTSLEVIAIDEQEHSITFCYVEGGNTIGTQKIILESADETTTLIKHVTNYRSVKPWKLRDKKLYPHFHTKSIDQIHKNALGDKLAD